MAPNERLELRPGTKIGFYEILPAVAGEQGDGARTCIGRGGFAALYRVSRGSKVFALKLAHHPLSTLSALERQSLEEWGDREIAALKSLRHPNIVRVHAFDRWPDDDGRAFIVMDFVEGDRLDAWRAKRRPSVRRICEVFIAIARALHAAHDQRIYHRDLKCSNVLVRAADSQPVIVDWGVAKPASSYTITHVNATVGTPDLFAPEYCKWALSPNGTKFEMTPATELHSVGYMLYQLLTGRSPFPLAIDEVERMRSIITMDRENGLGTPSELNANSPHELDAVVMRLLEKEPEKRYQSGEELARALEELLADVPVSWDSPLEIPLLSASAEHGAVEAALLELSKDDSVTHLVEPPRPPISMSSLERPGFISIEERAPPAPSAPELAPPVPDPVDAAAAKVRETSNERRYPPRALAVAIGSAVLLAAIVVVALLGRTDRKRPENLLARIEQQEQGAREADKIAGKSQQESEPSILPPAATVHAPASQSNAVRAKATQANVERTTSSKGSEPRPVAPSLKKRGAHGAARAASPANKIPAATPGPTEEEDQPSWLKPLQTKVASPVPTKLGIPTGAHIKARLLTNLDSRTVAAGPVEARLVRPFILDGRAILPSGTVLIGNASTTGSRFTIRFLLLRLPDEREIAFEGLAYDILERKPGLAATRRIDLTPTKNDGVATKVAKEAANTLLSAASGANLGTTLATEAGRTIVNEPTPDSIVAGDGSALLLDAPIDFDVFVTRAM